MKDLKAISLFAGAGGCSLGFTQAGYKVVYANEFNPSAVATYKQNFPSTLMDDKDISLVDFNEVLKEIGLKPGEVDILIGGPPCQGFSTAGARQDTDPRNQLLKSYLKALLIIKPKWFLMENVEGLLTLKNGEFLYETLQELENLGYSFRVDKIYAQEYGVPQRRKRIFIWGNSLGISQSLPEAQHILSNSIFNDGVSLGDALFSLPSPKENHNIPNHEYPKISDINLERISLLKPGQTMKNLPEELQHESFKKRANRRVADGMPSEKRGGAPSGLKRLKIDEPCLTITSAAIREFIHPNENRPLTIRECARVQTFPDNFYFSGNNQQVIQQIGNAIPPHLAKIFALHISSLGMNKVSNSNIHAGLQGFSLTKAQAMSPALEHTFNLLDNLIKRERKYQNEFIFEES